MPSVHGWMVNEAAAAAASRSAITWLVSGHQSGEVKRSLSVAAATRWVSLERHRLTYWSAVWRRTFAAPRHLPPDRPGQRCSGGKCPTSKARPNPNSNPTLNSNARHSNHDLNNLTLTLTPNPNPNHITPNPYRNRGRCSAAIKRPVTVTICWGRCHRPIVTVQAHDVNFHDYLIVFGSLLTCYIQAILPIHYSMTMRCNCF